MPLETFQRRSAGSVDGALLLRLRRDSGEGLVIPGPVQPAANMFLTAVGNLSQSVRVYAAGPSAGGFRVTDKRRTEFELSILPHLGAAYGLARWLLRHPQDAEDAVQDSMLKAFNAFDSWSGGDGAAWLLAIVRNTCLTRLERRSAQSKVVVLHEVMQTLELSRHPALPQPPVLQDQAMIAEEECRRVHAAIAALPLQFREVLVLREFHELSYREIADIVATPVGTVMSRLSRARERMKALLSQEAAADESGKAS